VSVIYQCDKCKRQFTNATDVINLRGTDEDGPELQADVCDDCFQHLMQLPNEEGVGIDDDTDVVDLDIPADVPLRVKHTQLDLTGIAPEDRENRLA
jgi:hypothetical protein